MARLLFVLGAAAVTLSAVATATQALDLGSPQANEWADFRKQIPHLRIRFGRWFHKTYFGFPFAAGLR